MPARVPPPSPPHVVWDWNGTLLDDAAAVIEATGAAFAEAGIGVTVTPDVYRRNFTRPIPLFYERLLGRPISAEEWPELDHAFHRHYALLHERCTLAAGAGAVLEELNARGWTQSICSMLPDEYLRPAVERHGIAGFFVRVDGLRDGRRGGVKLRHLAEHVARIGADPARTVVVGDTVDDALAARGAGIPCILLDGGAGLHERAALAEAGARLAVDLGAALRLLTEGAASGEPRAGSPAAAPRVEPVPPARVDPCAGLLVGSPRTDVRASHDVPHPPPRRPAPRALLRPDGLSRRAGATPPPGPA